MPRQYAAQIASTRKATSAGTPQSWPAGQPKVWTFIEFEAPDDMAEELAHAISDVLEPDFGWWPDFCIGDCEHVIIYADPVSGTALGTKLAELKRLHGADP